MFGWDESLYQLRDNLHRNVDYVLVSPRCWTALAAWYGSNSPLPRSVICTKPDGGGSPLLSAVGAVARKVLCIDVVCVCVYVSVCVSVCVIVCVCVYVCVRCVWSLSGRCVWEQPCGSSTMEAFL